MTDQVLIERYLKGDINAFNLLVWRWEKPIFNFAYRYVGNREYAKEVTQQTFIKVYKNLRRLKDNNKFSAWIHQIALNVCRDELKRHKKHFVSVQGLEDNNREHGSMLPEELLDDPGVRPDSSAHNVHLTEILKKALQVIPEEQRIVVIMKEYQGLKFTEIAEILNESINTVKSRMYYGLNALRKVLNEWKIDREAIGYEL